MRIRTALSVSLVLLPLGAAAQIGPVGTEFQVSSYTTGDQVLPVVATGADGASVMVWQSFGQDGSGPGVFGQRYDRMGQAVGTEFQVNIYATGYQRFPAVAAGADGAFVVAWEGNYQDGSGYGVFARRYDSVGQAAGTEFQVNTFTMGYQRFPAVAAGADGAFVVAWQSVAQDGSGYGVFGRRYDRTGQAVGTEFQVNSYTTNSQLLPAVAASADGAFVVAWQGDAQDGDRIGVFGQRFDSLGEAAGAEFQINSYTTNIQLLPAVAAGADGVFVVAWQSIDQDGGADGVFGQRYDSMGQVVGTEFQVNSYTLAEQTDPTVAAGADGTFVVVWQSQFQDGYFTGVFGQRYDDAGQVVGTEFQVNTYTPGFQRFAAVAAGADGAFVVAWQSIDQDGGNEGVFGQRFAGPTTPTPCTGQCARAGTEFQVNSYTTGTQRLPAVAVGADGTFVVAWESLGQDGYGYGVFGQRFDSVGQSVGTEFQVNSFAPGDQRLPAVAAGVDGAFVVAWQSIFQDGDGYGMFGQRYDGLGQAVGTEFQVNTYTTGDQRSPAVAADGDGAFVVAWHSVQQDGNGYGVFGQRFDRMGQSVGAEFQVNTFTTGNQRSPAIAVGADGAFVVAWESYLQDAAGYGVFGQRYDNAGQAAGTEFQVNTFTTSYQRLPAVAAGADGAFMVAWQSYQDGESTGVSGRRYDSAGQPVGAEFQVNSYTIGFQRYPVIAAGADDAFVVAWQSQDGSVYGVFEQRYDSTGQPVGAEFQVNSYTTDNQNSPAIAAGADGTFVVAWQSLEQDGSSYGVFGQRFAEPVSSPTPSATSTATPTATPSATATHSMVPTPTLTATPTPIPCAGDCDGDGKLSVDELITGVAIALDHLPIGDCSAFDLDENGRITIDELVAAVDAALNECAD